MKRTRGTFLATVPLLLCTSVFGASAASAAPAISSTTHVTSLTAWGSPLAPATNNGCPSWAINDAVWIDLVGNGVSHFNVNGAGDSWFTSTFEGNGTLSFFPGQITYDQFGNIVTVAGSAEQIATGHLTQWFGAEMNRQNAVQHGTATFVGTTGTGAKITLHFHIQAVWSVGSDPYGPPDHLYVNVTNC